MRIEKKEVPQPKFEYVLTLDEREARALKAVMGSRTGKDIGPGEFYNDLYDKLRDLGVLPEYSSHEYVIGSWQATDTWPEEER